MARFRKIDTRIWNDAKFRELSDQEKLIFLFLLTHPHMTSLGAMRAGIAGLADELGWSFETVSKGFTKLFRKVFLEYDEKACFLALPNFLKYNLPENPNVVKSWKESLIYFLNANLNSLSLQGLKGLPKPFLASFERVCQTVSKPFQNSFEYPNPNRTEIEREPEGSVCSSSGSNIARAREPNGKSKSTDTRAPAADFVLTDELRSWAETAAPEIDPEAEAERFRDHYARDGTKFVDWQAAFRKWMRDAVDRLAKARAPTAERRESVGDRNARVFREIEAANQGGIP